MPKVIHTYMILTIDKDGKEKRIHGVAKDIVEIVLGITHKNDPEGIISEFFLTLMLDGRAKIEDHKNGLDHIVWAE